LKIESENGHECDAFADPAFRRANGLGNPSGRGGRHLGAAAAHIEKQELSRFEQVLHGCSSPAADAGRLDEG